MSSLQRGLYFSIPGFAEPTTFSKLFTNSQNILFFILILCLASNSPITRLVSQWPWYQKGGNLIVNTSFLFIKITRVCSSLYINKRYYLYISLFFRWDSVGEKMINSGSWWPKEGTAHGRLMSSSAEAPVAPLPHHSVHFPYFMAAPSPPICPSITWELPHTPISRSSRNSTL